MSIVALKKVTLFGPVAEKASVLGWLQEYGKLHLLPLGANHWKEQAKSKEVERSRWALKYLEDCPRHRRQAEGTKETDIRGIVEEVLANKDKRDALTDRLDWLNKHIEDLEPWGDFEWPEEGAFGELRLWFYVVPHYMVKQIDAGLIWEEVHRDYQGAYVVVIHPEEPKVGAVPVVRAHTGSIPLSKLKAEREDLWMALEDLEAERESKTRWSERLRVELVREEDQATYLRGLAQAWEGEGIFAVQGWLPAFECGRLEKEADLRGLACLCEEAAEGEKPPTLLENPKALSGGEDLIQFYQTPAYDGWDPSRVVFFSFALFFAMILSDAGYALVLGGLLWLFRGRLGKDQAGHRMRTLGWCLVGCSVVYGVLVGSYFGVSPSSPWLQRLHLLDMNNFDQMMVVSVGVGVVHVAIGLVVKLWQRRGKPSMFVPMGWLLGIVGGFLAWRGSVPLGSGMMAAGGVLIVGLSGERPVRSFWDGLRHLLAGLLALADVSKAFGDILSYLRLFALGLASASLAVTFNKLAADVWVSMPGVGLVMAALILLLGHTLNFALSIVSGVVHGLRLNVIEFFNWSLSDEGYPFQAYRKKEEQTWNK